MISIGNFGKKSKSDYIIAAWGTFPNPDIQTKTMLNVTDHSRDSAGLKYIYPVISRRAGGVSIGINLNVNNACNWACIYCQVPDLTRGAPPPVDLMRLESELDGFLDAVVNGDYLARNAPPEARQLMDVAFSGNGEPTSAPEFTAAVDCVAQVLARYGLLQTLTLRLITNGSLLHRPGVRDGIARIGSHGGEVWFKLDRATSAGMEQVNGIKLPLHRVAANLSACADLADTWVQTCWFAIDGQEADEAEIQAYLSLIESVRQKIKGVHLYGLARPSLQPGATHLSNLTREAFTRFARRIESLGVPVIANP